MSLKTVSRVVNREPAVRPEVQARVEDAINALAYRRNTAARSLRKGNRIGAIGLVIADLLNPFYAGVAKAVESVAVRHDAMVMMASSEEGPKREREIVLNLLQHPVDGLLLVPSADDHRYLDAERRLGARVVFLDRPGRFIDADAVVLDNVGGARSAVEHLIVRGHRRIAFVGDSFEVLTAAERHEGYRQALEAAGIPYDPALVKQAGSKIDVAEAVAAGLLESDASITAAFAGNNRTCVGVLRYVRKSGRQVGIVGFDDFELADLLPVPVSVVGYDAGELGRMGAELLFARMAGDSRPPQRIVVPTRLIDRGSGEFGIR